MLNKQTSGAVAKIFQLTAHSDFAQPDSSLFSLDGFHNEWVHLRGKEAGGPSEAEFSRGISIKLKFTMFWLDDNTAYNSSDWSIWSAEQ